MFSIDINPIGIGEINNTGIIDDIKKNHADECSCVHQIKNHYCEKASLLVRDFESFRYSGKYYIRVNIQAHKKNTIDKIKLVVFANKGEKTEINEEAKAWYLQSGAKEPYFANFCEGSFYAFEAKVDDLREGTIIDWLNLEVNEDIPLEFASVGIHDDNYAENTFFPLLWYKIISDDEVARLEISNRRSRRNRSKDAVSTSLPEQSLFFYIRRFFPDAESRARIIDDETLKAVEADVYIPSINVVIEYDGGVWHETKEKLARDNYKNKVFNRKGMYVIHVRDVGLPELDDFDGKVFYHGKAPKGMHTNEYIVEVIRHIGHRTNNEKLKEFSLTSRAYIENQPTIFAKLYTEEKQFNFTSHSAFQYWNAKKNGDLNPKNIDDGCKVIAWFKCPNNKDVIRPINKIVNLNQPNELIGYKPDNNFSVYKVCPFIPNDYYEKCAQNCTYFIDGFSDIIKQYIDHGDDEVLDKATLEMFRATPKVAFRAIKFFLNASDDGKDRFRKSFIIRVVMGTRKYYIAENVELDKPEDLEIIKKFNELYQRMYIWFNPAVFDVTDAEKRKILWDYIDDCFEKRDNYSIALSTLFRKNYDKHTYSKVFKKEFATVLKRNGCDANAFWRSFE